MKYFSLIALALALLSQPGHSQRTVDPSDLIAETSFEELKEQFFRFRQDSAKANPIARKWLMKARAEEEVEEEINALRALSFNAGPGHKTRLANLALKTAVRTGNPELIGASYLSRGILHHELHQYDRAMDDYLEADKFIVRIQDEYLSNKLKYQIGFTKYYLGYYEESIALLESCKAYFAEENDRAYLNVLHGLSLAHAARGDAHAAQAAALKGLTEARLHGLDDVIPHFSLSLGISQHIAGKRAPAIATLSQIVPLFARAHDTTGILLSHYYLGVSYWKDKQYDRSLPHLIKVDSLLKIPKYLRPDLLNNYVLLREYSRMHHDIKGELRHINGLLSADSITRKNHKNLSEKILKGYDRRKLLDEKKEIEEAARRNTAMGSAFISCLLISTGVLYRRQRQSKKRIREFEQLISGSRDTAPTAARRPRLNLSPEVAETLLTKLEHFEKNKRYLEKEMTLTRVAEILHTNPKYAGAIIAHYRGKKTIEYISELKIAYIIEKLNTESRYRHYTNKALGEEAGFGSTQIFTKTFKSLTGSSPTDYIARLKAPADPARDKDAG